MAERLIYIDAATGSATPSDPTQSNDPYSSILIAEAAERGDLVTATTNLVMVMLDGAWNENTGIIFNVSNWTTDGTYDILLRPENAFATTINCTSNTYVKVIELTGDIDLTMQDFTIDHQGSLATNNHGAVGLSASENVLIQRMILRGSARVVETTGINAGSTVKNCVIIANGSNTAGAARIGFRTQFRHNTVIHLGSQGDAIEVDSAVLTVVQYCYGHAGGTGDGIGGLATAATQTAILTSDLTGDTTSIAYSTANFTNVTTDTEDLSIPTGSALKDAASGSSETLDLLGATRATPDTGAYEFIAAGGANPHGPFGHPLTGAFGGPI